MKYNRQWFRERVADNARALRREAFATYPLARIIDFGAASRQGRGVD